MSQLSYKHPKQVLIQVSKSSKIQKYKPQKIIQKTTQQVLLKIQKIMRQFRQLNVAEFLRLFMYVLKKEIDPGEQFYMVYGLFKVFKQICRAYKSTKISFSQLSSFITEKMPKTDQDVIVKQKLLPMGFDIPQEQKMQLTLPQISGKVLTQRLFLNPLPSQLDKYQHVNRTISQAFYSYSNQTYYSIDLPSNFIRVYDKYFNQIMIIESELEISKKQSTIVYMAWSEVEGRVGAILGNYSLSFWSKDDNFRFEVNVPLPNDYLFNPFVVIGYMESMREWYVIDNRPVVFGLSSKNFQPVYQISNFKMLKQRPMEKILTLQMKYQKLLCVGFERKVFLLSLKKRQLITQLVNFKTSITSIVFSETFQTLFVSNFDNFFKAYELTEHCDLTEKGKLEGHKHQILHLGTVEKKPIVYSLQESYVMKLWDIRDLTCFQTFTVLKNVRYLQMFSVKQGICLVGSKLYLYKWAIDKNQPRASLQKSSQNKKIIDKGNGQKIILMNNINKNILIVSNHSLKLYSHVNGNLLKVIRGLFKSVEISFAYLNSAKKQIYISNPEGHFLVLQTQGFTEIHSFTFLSNPVSMFYSEKEDLITLSGSGQIHIMRWKRQEDFDLKRRIFNEKQNLQMCKVFPLHDLIAAVYQLQNNGQIYTKGQKRKKISHNPIFFYTFEKGKAIGFINTDNLVTFEIHKSKNILIVLEKDRFKIYSFHNSMVSLSFTLHQQIKLWSEEKHFLNSLTHQFKDYVSILQERFHSHSLLLFQNSLTIVSNFSCLFYSLQIDFQTISPENTKKSEISYNPYRISVQSHVEAFSQINKESEVVIDQRSQIINVTTFNYKQTKAFAMTICCFQIGNVLGIYNNKMDLHFFDHLSHHLVGVINTELTLPKMWNFTFYEEEELQDIDFVLDYFENQEKKKLSGYQKNSQSMESSKLFYLTQNGLKTPSLDKKRKRSPLTIQKIIRKMESQQLDKLPSSQQPNNFSLRQRKLMLQKQREQKLRHQNFLQHQEQQEQNQVRSHQSHDLQSNINEVLNFFALNRNEVVKYKGIKEEEVPQQVKLLEKKLENSLRSLQRKSSILMSTGAKNTSLMRVSDFNTQKSINKIRSSSKMESSSISMNQSGKMFQKIGSFKMMQESLQSVLNQSPYKKLKNSVDKRPLVKILQEEVRRSKFSKGQQSLGKRNSSLPLLKKLSS